MKIDTLYVVLHLRIEGMLNETLSIKINKTQNSKIESVDWENLPFGKVFSDHMLVMDYKEGPGEILR